MNSIRRCYANWTPEQDELLRAAYRSARLRELSAKLRRLEEVTGYSRDAVGTRAEKLGIKFTGWSRWTEEQDMILEAMAGVHPVARIAKELGKTLNAVYVRLSRKGYRGFLSDGYTAEELREALGVSAVTVRRWEDEGLIVRDQNGRFTEKAVAWFLRKHNEEYDLRRVDQVWFKGIAFPKKAERVNGYLGAAQ